MYKIDFGKLAYVKTEELNKRLKTVEKKGCDNYKSIYFERENIDPLESGEVSESIQCLNKTDIIFNLSLSISGGIEISVYLNEVFVFSQTILGGQEKNYTFEAKGLEAGEKKIVIKISGGGFISYLGLTASGSGIEYSISYAVVSYAEHLNEDYLLQKNGENLKLYKLIDEDFVDLNGNLAKCKYCQALSYCGKLILFYTVWDKTLFYITYENGVFSKEIPIIFNVDRFSVAGEKGLLYIYYLQNDELFVCAGVFENQILLSDAMPSIARRCANCSAFVKDGVLYLICADEKLRSKLLIGQKKARFESEVLTFNVQNI